MGAAFSTRLLTSAGFAPLLPAGRGIFRQSPGRAGWRQHLPLMITASLSPVGSHTMEWTSPPILKTARVALRSPRSANVPSAGGLLLRGGHGPPPPPGEHVRATGTASPTSPPHRASRRWSLTDLPRWKLFLSLPLVLASPLKQNSLVTSCPLLELLHGSSHSINHTFISQAIHNLSLFLQAAVELRAATPAASADGWDGGQGRFPLHKHHDLHGEKKSQSWALNPLEKFPCKPLMTIRSSLQTKSNVCVGGKLNPTEILCFERPPRHPSPCVSWVCLHPFVPSRLGNAVNKQKACLAEPSRSQKQEDCLETSLWRLESFASAAGSGRLTPVLGEGQGVDDRLAQHREEQSAAVRAPAPRLWDTEPHERPLPRPGSWQLGFGTSWKLGSFTTPPYTHPRALEATSAPHGWEMPPSYLAASFDSGPPLARPHLSLPHSGRETN